MKKKKKKSTVSTDASRLPLCPGKLSYTKVVEERKMVRGGGGDRTEGRGAIFVNRKRDVMIEGF